MLRTTFLSCVGLSIVALSACREPGVSWTQTVEPITVQAPAEGAGMNAAALQLFTSRCAPCHGSEGRGDGVAAPALNPHPQNFHDATWQASITDANIERAIREGGEAVGKSPLMPSNPDLVDQPQMIRALRTYIRSFRNVASR
jgi:mono/diheme cytochrome c family protein